MKTIISKLIESGMTQVELAKVAGCSQSYISDMLNGKNSNPSIKISIAIAKACEERGIKWKWEDMA